MDSQNINPPLEGLMVGLPLQFTILHHTGVDAPHYDLLIDFAGREKLPTWRIFASPDQWKDEPPSPERILDHRRHYLTYEGPISNNRGEVQRIATGTARILKTTPEFFRLYFPAPVAANLDLPITNY